MDSFLYWVANVIGLAVAGLALIGILALLVTVGVILYLEFKKEVGKDG